MRPGYVILSAVVILLASVEVSSVASEKMAKKSYQTTDQEHEERVSGVTTAAVEKLKSALSSTKISDRLTKLLKKFVRPPFRLPDPPKSNTLCFHMINL
ncbi:hypothetical protein F442_12641 [Phytophthora nicotianae P10297]|uniref:RxLR effector protein n=1 Tax=Phytophthora nicotianae P10297 TaxID=1317064 RepID=W2YYV0_PHYNI|nr:hypothetical protein F442_12641 [Phytophthora nicotianae P10297]